MKPVKMNTNKKLTRTTTPQIAGVRATQPAIIEAKIDVGFGNNLFLRGEGAGLSWDHGTPLKCIDGKTWQWSAPTEDKVKFKLLLNDSVWAQGADLVATPGKTVRVSPAF